MSRSTPAFLKAFGSYLPVRVVSNQELADRLDCTPEWIFGVSGIEERRYASPDESVVDLGVAAARQCLDRAARGADEIEMLLMASGTAERRFPGPASSVASRLGLQNTPAVDVPFASAGSLFALGLAAQLTEAYRNVLVVAAEKMSSVVLSQQTAPGVAILFGDGAGACIVGANGGLARLLDAALHSDGAFADDLRLEFGAPLEMKGRSVILQASRKIPAVIGEVLEKNTRTASDVRAFLMHQANQNLIDRIARALNVETDRFYSNIRRYGNTSSASMLIAAEEWWAEKGPRSGDLICFAAFGAGYHWGAQLAQVE